MGSQRAEDGVNQPAQHLGQPWKSPSSPALLLGRATAGAEGLRWGVWGGKWTGVAATDLVFPK